MNEIEKIAGGLPAEPPFRPIAHLAPARKDGSRAALCGAPLLGIRAFGEFQLCPECVRLKRQAWLQGPS